MEKIIAGLVQMDSGPDMNENMRMAEQYVREAAEQGAKLILFPETAEYTGADMPGHASAVPGYVSRRFSSLAKRYGVYLHCGSMTVRRYPGRPSTLYNLTHIGAQCQTENLKCFVFFTQNAEIMIELIILLHQIVDRKSVV